MSSPTLAGTPDVPAPLDRLVDLIQVETVATDRFRGQSEDIGTPAVFGGQVLGQALMAASLTAPAGRMVHSLHAYFLLPGQHASIDYEVERVRDGSSFATRRVVAQQRGVPIFELLASFQGVEDGPDRHDPMPAVPGPQGIRSEMEHRRAMVDRLPAALRDKAIVPSGIEYRPVVPFDLFDAAPREARASVWLRAAAPLPDSPALHRALLAYASDHGLLLTATLPHGLSLLKGEVRLASVDHAMWFHREFRIDDWLLYQMDSPTVCGNRALCRGSVYSSDGRLVASTMQEGLMRVR
ncbi:MAG TPA: acyl-CoA thioesterase II [Burkholderiaceae bacterium]|nr:acyl-CoA thioesterase II [Burkholderiaceae bacterium]